MNPQFQRFLDTMAANQKQKQPSLIRLKVLQRQGLLNDYNINSMLRGGSLLTPIPSTSSMVCEKEKEKALRALNNLYDIFHSCGSSTFA